MTRYRFALAGLLALVQAPVMATALVDGGFETKGATVPVNTYCYDNQCGTSPWVNLGGLTGIIRSGEGAWGYVVANGGNYYGFVQNNGVLAQSFVATATGTAAFNWFDTNRASYYGSPYGGLQSYAVSIFDGITTVNIGSFTTAIGPWVARTSSTVTLTAGTTYSLRFTGLAPGDSTAFIDNVSLATATVPEPASWALMIAGFGLTGATMRRRSAIIA